MKMKKDEIKQFVLKVVHGEEDWSSLKRFGLNMFLKEGEEWIIYPSLINPICPDIIDIATGIVTLQNNKEKLKIWASFVLATDIIDLSELEKSKDGERIMNCLWDISFGEKIDNKMIKLLERIVHQNLIEE